VAGQGQLALRGRPAQDLDAQLVANQEARARNARLAAEVSDLKEGLEMVEEKARAELGMVRPDEILVQVTK
jgi:cell division protein FtsB